MLESSTRRGPWCTFVVLAFVWGLAWPDSANAETPSGWRPMEPSREFAGTAPRIVNGLLTSSFPSTGALLFGGKPEIAQLQCSGTLIGCDTFLTAAHCVCDFDGATCQDIAPPDPRSFTVFLQHGGFFEVRSIAVHPDFVFPFFDSPMGDVAVLRLGRPVDGIAPSSINDLVSVPFGTAGTIVGFGRSEEVDYGLKRFGAVTTSECTNSISGEANVCWTAPLTGPPGTDSSTCNGDSGGPLFADVGGGVAVAGVTSGGVGSCFHGLSFDANVFTYAGYIAAQAGDDLGATACGCLPSAESAGAPVFAGTGQLGQAAPDGRHLVAVPAGTRRLRIAMNAVEAFGGIDFDLFVKQGGPPTSSVFDCRQSGPGQYGFCEFEQPAAGNWFVLVRRFSGQGRYQVTATAYGSEPSVEGEACDDGNSCTADDQCADGACVGTMLSGVACDDGDGCTTGDRCVSGLCLAEGEVTCTDPDPDQCREGAMVCHPTIGCVSPPKPDFTPCDSHAGIACTFPDNCFAGTCIAQPDFDADHTCDFDDNCMLAANPDQKDIDRDGRGNACDPSDGSLRLQKATLIGRHSETESDGRISVRAEFTTSAPDVFDPRKGVAVKVVDSLNLSRTFIWRRSACATSDSGTTMCSKRDGDFVITIRPLRSTTPGAVTYRVRFRARDLLIATPFVPPVGITLVDGPGVLVDGTDRTGGTRDCASSNPGLRCVGPYAGPRKAFVTEGTASLLD